MREEGITAESAKSAEGTDGVFAVSPVEINRIGSVVVDAAIEVHRTLGPGLLESAYEIALAWELSERDVIFERQKALPVRYKGVQLDCGYRLDLVVANCVVVELKAVEELSTVHEAQMITYLKLSRHRLGYLINFNSKLLKHGLRRFANGL